MLKSVSLSRTNTKISKAIIPVTILIRNTITFILIIVQQDATQSSLFIIQQVHLTCFGCQPQPSSGVHKTVTTAFGTGHIFLCS